MRGETTVYYRVLTRLSDAYNAVFDRESYDEQDWFDDERKLEALPLTDKSFCDIVEESTDIDAESFAWEFHTPDEVEYWQEFADKVLPPDAPFDYYEEIDFVFERLVVFGPFSSQQEAQSVDITTAVPAVDKISKATDYPLRGPGHLTRENDELDNGSYRRRFQFSFGEENAMSMIAARLGEIHRIETRARETAEDSPLAEDITAQIHRAVDDAKTAMRRVGYDISSIQWREREAAR